MRYSKFAIISNVLVFFLISSILIDIIYHLSLMNIETKLFMLVGNISHIRTVVGFVIFCYSFIWYYEMHNLFRKIPGATSKFESSTVASLLANTPVLNFFYLPSIFKELFVFLKKQKHMKASLLQNLFFTSYTTMIAWSVLSILANTKFEMFRTSTYALFYFQLFIFIFFVLQLKSTFTTLTPLEITEQSDFSNGKQHTDQGRYVA